MRIVLDTDVLTAALRSHRGASRLLLVAALQLINVAVAEKLSALRTEEYFTERAKRGSVSKALRVLKRLGTGNPPGEGDRIPASRGRRSSRPPETQ